MQFPITIGLHRSFLLWCLPLLGAALALGLALALPLAAGVGAGMVLASVVGMMCLLRRRSRWQRVQALRLSADGALSVAFADAPDYFLPAIVEPGATVHRWLTVIRLRAGGGSYAVVLTPEAIAADDFRRLRVFLRCLARFNAPDAAV